MDEEKKAYFWRENSNVGQNSFYTTTDLRFRKLVKHVVFGQDNQAIRILQYKKVYKKSSSQLTEISTSI